MESSWCFPNCRSSFAAILSPPFDDTHTFTCCPCAIAAKAASNNSAAAVRPILFRTFTVCPPSVFFLPAHILQVSHAIQSYVLGRPAFPILRKTSDLYLSGRGSGEQLADHSIVASV